MSIFKETFRGFVKNQLGVRRQIQAQSVKDNNALVWQQTKQCVIRATSLVDYNQDINISLNEGFESLIERIFPAILTSEIFCSLFSSETFFTKGFLEFRSKAFVFSSAIKISPSGSSLFETNAILFPLGAIEGE